MKSKSKLYDELFEREGYSSTFPKSNARILWNARYGKIHDLVVEDFSSPDEKQYLYKTYSFDLGNCSSDWEDWGLSDVLIKIFVSYIVPSDVRKKILFELSKIQEWRPGLSLWIYKNWGE